MKLIFVLLLFFVVADLAQGFRVATPSSRLFGAVGAGAIATATTLIGILTAEIGSGLVGALAGAGIDLGLTALTNPPTPFPTAPLNPKVTCP